MSLSLIIPTLNAADRIAATVEAWRSAVSPDDVIVSDGGSTDETVGRAAAAGATVIGEARGRGAQLAAGAQAARRDWLLFVHADTRPGEGAGATLTDYMADPLNGARAAALHLALDDPHPAARRIERLANWRSRALALPYGDQGLLITRGHYEAIGGYRPLPLMEDVDIVRRIGRRGLTILDAAAVTSAERYRRDGWWARPMRNLGVLSLYLLGVSPERLARMYEKRP